LLTEVSKPAMRTVARIVWEIVGETDKLLDARVVHTASTGPIIRWAHCEQKNFEVGRRNRYRRLTGCARKIR
jgi:hypothetical protein